MAKIRSPASAPTSYPAMSGTTDREHMTPRTTLAHRLVVATAIGLLLTGTGGASPRAGAEGRPTVPCDTARLYTTADSVDEVAYASLVARDRQSLPPSFLARLLDEIEAQLRVPSDLTVPPTSSVLEPVWLNACRGGCPPAIRERGEVMRAREAPAVEGLATFVLRRSGDIADIKALTDLRADPDIGPVLARTLSLVDGRRRFPRFPPEVRAESVALRLRVGLRADTLMVSRPMFAVRLPLQLTQAVRLESSVPATLRYRPAAGSAVTGDSVVVQLVVDAAGQPAPGSAVILHGRDARFADAVLEAVPRWHFTPAIVDGCAVKLLVQQPIVLRIE
jgi:hypothetical protein